VQLQDHLNTIDEAQYALICGTGGIGKTTLALQYCLVNEHAHSLIIWVNARTTKTAEESYIWLLKEIIRSKAEDAPQRRPDFSAIAQDLGIQGMLKQDGSLDVEDNPVQRQKAVEGVRSWLEQQVDRSWLIVFDEVDDVQVPIKDFIPRCKWGSYIVTTRRPEVRDYANYGFDLGGLSIGEGIELLLHGTAFDSTDPQGDLTC
jgi:energy-coupling factor transporter ATP-binding protein EcfA2